MSSTRSVLVCVLMLLIGGAAPSLAQDATTLAAQLESGTEAERLAAGASLQALMETDYEGVAAAVIPLASSPSARARHDAAFLLMVGAMFSHENGESAALATASFTALLTDGDPQTREYAARGLAHIQPRVPLSAEVPLRGLLADPAVEVRELSVSALGLLESASEETVAALISELEANDFRAAAAESLGNLRAVEAVEPLTTALSDADSFVRLKAIYALSELGGAATGAIPALEDVAANDPEPLNREIAASAISHIQSANSPPDCDAAEPSVAVLWPPNHKLNDVSVTGVIDPEGDAVLIQMVSVMQDEGTQASGTGNTCPDAVLADSVAQLRSERAGSGDGRVYQVNFSALDSSGASCTGAVKVCVPKNNQDDCTEGALIYSSTVCQ